VKENYSVTIIPIILIALLIAGTIAIVFSPLFRGANGRWSWGGMSSAAMAADELAARRDAIYAALKDAEFDRETGKLAEEDYQLVRTRYMAEAAQILRQLDQLTPETEAALDAEIERAVATLRSNGKKVSLPDDYSPDLIQAVDAEVALLVKHAATSDKHVLACPDCGQPYRPGDTFCAACGASLANTCPQCGAPHQPGDAFCSHCGVSLTERLTRKD
jgi:rRNA maturation endonuclease Nob1